MGKARPSEMAAFSATDIDGKLATSDLSPIRVNQDSMAIDRMEELVSKYGVTLSSICRVLFISE